MSPTAAEVFAAMVRSKEEQDSNAQDARPSTVSQRWSPSAARFREDPFRENETLEALLSFIEPHDVVLDVGGGAGRYLPIATRCREYVNVEPSAGMGSQFEQAVTEAGVKNARWQQDDWFDSQMEGDVTFCANVVYYIENIEPFLAHLDAASRRRVMIVMHSVPPTNVGAALYRQVHQREPALAPSHRELLPVLWNMGILPEVRVLGPSDFIVERARFASREEAIAAAIPGHFGGDEAEQIRARLTAHFDELWSPANGGYMRKPIGTAEGISRVLLITWETRHA
jgi:hypothetical protein